MAWAPPPVGDVIEIVTIDGLTKCDTIDRAEISNTKLIASYNWVEDSVPKIMVPGKPPRWTPLTQPRRLPQDTGEFYRDINAAAHASHPLEPAIVSIMTMNPEPMPVNLVACGSTIGGLLRFSRGEADTRPFRMFVEIVGDTVHLIRRENNPKELIPDVKGYGHTFPDNYTTWDGDVRRSTSHQRIMMYRFAGLDMMVRFEGDGFIESPGLKQSKTPTIPSPTDNNDVLPDLSAMGIGRPVLGPGTGESGLKVVEGGQTVPQAAVFELKTRSVKARDKDTLGEQLHRLWVSRVEQFVLAYHERGLFNDIQIKNVKGQVKEWEDTNQSSLRRLAALLHLIIDHAREAPDGKLDIVCSSGDSLEIRKQVGEDTMLSTSVQAEWATWLGQATPMEPHSSAGSSPGSSPIARFDMDNYDFYDTYDDTYDSDEFKDFTACDKECGYCGKCEY
ncbi:hypothetical protein EDB80DRAFT_586520 [Ilyonectria destructans]|nr:hypothetical protein EDB80DRAFT_586520 [Ilyonectria destructans]